MPYVWVDEEDDENARQNRLTWTEAHRRSGWYPKKLKAMVDDGILQTEDYKGRTFVNAISLARAIQNYSPSLEDRISQAEDAAARGVFGARGRAMELRELQIQRGRAAGDPDFEMVDDYGREIPQPGMTRNVEAPAAHPADSFLRKFGGGQ
jgi:hypothetical protein